METPIRDCIGYFLTMLDSEVPDELKEKLSKTNKSYTFRNALDTIIKEWDNSQNKNELTKNFVLRIGEECLKEDEEILWYIINYFYGIFLVLFNAHKLKEKNALSTFSLILAKGLVELYAYEKKEMSNLLKNFDDNYDVYSDIDKESLFRLYSIIINCVKNKEEDFLCICDKLPTEDFLRNLNIITMQNDLASFSTMLILTPFTNIQTLKIFNKLFVTHVVRMTVFMEGFYNKKKKG